MARLVIDGFGQLELNNAAFRRDGRVEAQCKLDPVGFASIPAENGMLLAVDKVNGIVKLPVANETLPIAINYSAEHIYDERTPGLKNFRLTVNDFYPRMGYLAVGDLFTTNCVSYNTSEYADETALKNAIAAVKTTKVYGTYSTDGSIMVTATKPQAGLTLEVVKPFTMPDGQYAIQFRVLVA